MAGIVSMNIGTSIEDVYSTESVSYNERSRSPATCHSECSEESTSLTPLLRLSRGDSTLAIFGSTFTPTTPSTTRPHHFESLAYRPRDPHARSRFFAALRMTRRGLLARGVGAQYALAPAPPLSRVSPATCHSERSEESTPLIPLPRHPPKAPATCHSERSEESTPLTPLLRLSRDDSIHTVFHPTSRHSGRTS